MDLFIVRSIDLLLLLLPFSFLLSCPFTVIVHIGEIRLNPDGFRSPYLLKFLYANCEHVDTYNQVYSQEGYQIDDFPAFLCLFNLIGW